MKTVLLLTMVMCVILLTLNKTYGEETPKAEPTTVGTPTQAGTPAPTAAPAPAPMPGPAFTGEKMQMFQPIAMDPALVRQSMQARSEYDDLNRRIMARTAKLYEENATIKDLQTELRDLQKKIDKLLAEDEELSALKKKYETITPEFPMGSHKGFATNATPFSPGR